MVGGSVALKLEEVYHAIPDLAVALGVTTPQQQGGRLQHSNVGFSGVARVRPGARAEVASPRSDLPPAPGCGAFASHSFDAELCPHSYAVAPLRTPCTPLLQPSLASHHAAAAGLLTESLGARCAATCRW